MQDEQNGLVHALIPFRYEGAPLRTTDALIEKIPEFSASAGVAKFSERLRLNLPDPFASHVKLLPHFFQRVIGIHADTKPHPQHAFFARG